MSAYKVVIIGAGNVASHLIRSITSSGHKLIQIYNRTLSHIPPTSINVTGSINSIRLDGDIYMICVKDVAIADFANQLRLENKLVVHTSGNRSIDLLKNSSENYGVFYPIQTFTKNVPINFKKVPIVIEANNQKAFGMLQEFAQSISNHVVEMSESERQKLNVAGVFVNNFTNHLYTLTYEYLKKEQIDFNILKPLIHNTVDKLDLGNPIEMQTGPAVRGDIETIESQLNLLKEYPILEKLYDQLTKSIIESKK